MGIRLPREGGPGIEFQVLLILLSFKANIFFISCIPRLGEWPKALTRGQEATTMNYPEFDPRPQIMAGESSDPSNNQDQAIKFTENLKFLRKLFYAVIL